ncbi:MAG: DUF1553 domain-containing protein [Ferruginibacter sp.]
MKLLLRKKYLLVIAVLIASVFIFTFSTRRHSVDYNTEIKPLLNKKCITCHGGVKRQSGFSLLFRADALAKNESGKPAIIPGDPEHSELVRRLNLKDPEERMPYKHPPLTKEEIGLLKQWIKEGAKWGDHWAYVPVEKISVPGNGGWFSNLFGKSSWGNNDIDQFIYKKLDEEDLEPSPEASKATLLRRVSLDLVGMPASPSLSNNFLSRKNENAGYEVLVDSLLNSPHFGERWAAMWMDLARYADTKGYERDDARSVWRYRDWLINAFNSGMPYDQFLTEQLAGDLLPDPSDAQYIATAFHRNTMTNDEGGTDNEEFRVAAVIDRVNTTWETLMGTTFSCVQCHSHPYDPFRHDEYYKFMAFFNNTRDEDTYDEYPLLREYHQQDSSKFVQLKNWLQQNAPGRTREITYFLKTGEPTINSLVADSLTNSALTDTKWLVLRKQAIARIKSVDLTDHSQLMVRFKSWNNAGKWTIHLDKADGPVLTAINVADSKGSWKIAYADIPPTQGHHDLYFTYSNAKLKTIEETGIQFDWFYFTDPFPGKEKPGYDSAWKYFNDLLYAKQVTFTSIMAENPTGMFRPTNVFERGNWLMKGAAVQADVPHTLNPMPANAPRNRLGLAMWVTDKRNPLTARTIVNRIWEQFFGQGIAETLEDLGTQGIQPTHQQLLDHLAWKLMNEYNWNLKKLMKEIVMSATYRQDSKVSQKIIEKDPFNKLYARGPRVRLSAEQIRDQALSVSGLISENMLGPSVFPYQPGGIWMSPWNGATWQKSPGPDQYRRALYTYWKRSAPYPSNITFDGPSREGCSARRIRTNTPLQALVTLNDSVYTEAAQNFAYRMRDADKTIKGQINKGYEMIFYTSISLEKLAVLEKLYNEALTRFKKDDTKMRLMAGKKEGKQNAETAALVVVAAAMMNLDEFITKN